MACCAVHGSGAHGSELLRFLDGVGRFRADAFRRAVEVAVLALEIVVGHTRYPRARVAARTRELRPLGLGYTNLAAMLMASGLPSLNPAGDVVGRHLTRHCSAIIYGVFPRLPDEARVFHKQVGFHDFYHGGDGGPAGHTGVIQQVQSPPEGLIRERLPFEVKLEA